MNVVAGYGKESYTLALKRHILHADKTLEQVTSKAEAGQIAHSTRTVQRVGCRLAVESRPRALLAQPYQQVVLFCGAVGQQQLLLLHR